ncbi:MAG: signal recognition particle receptor subunit alpha [Candidatus Nanoarchaeia archaeon]|nr:signal recognition particle receptor subunit alpha [Candidatus Nanoarchaeia archaeon]
MVLENLGNSLKESLSKITKSLFIDEKQINELVKEIQRALLQSDVNVKLVFSIGKKIKERAINEETPTGLSKKDYLVNIVYEELVSLVGKGNNKIQIETTPFTIMLVGLFGNGKTTTAGKLAYYFKKRGKKIAMISIDTWRPAAFEQLKQTGNSIGVPVFGQPDLKDPVKIYNKFKPELAKYDLIIVDTAGRDALNDELIEELNSINSAINANETILVMNADIGQSAEKQAQAFHNSCDVTGVILTKLDGTARGGGALVACSVTETPIKFIGIGEKVDAFEEFKPEGFIGRLLGMGDLETLLEKVHEAIDEDQAKDLGRKMLKGDFNLLDLYQQMNSMKKMGSLSKIVNLIPGMGKLNIPKEMLEGQEERVEKWKYLMDSMTKEELENPDEIKGTRLERISNGAGIPLEEIRTLLKQYKQSKKMMKMMKGMEGSEKDMQKMMQKMQQKKIKF